MKMKCYSILDSKSCAFSLPFFKINDATAVREFYDAVNAPDPKNMYWSHAEDFSLYLIGEYDDELGKLESRLPESLCTGVSVKKLPEQDLVLN